jgi:hypothetical protein
MRQRMQEGMNIFPDNKSRYRIVPLDQSFPSYLVQNRVRFSHVLR